jgi:magnesium and cobalt transporter
LAEDSSRGLFHRLFHWIKGLGSSPEDIQQEIKELIDEGEESGAISQVEGTMMEAVLRLRKTMVREVMVPRAEAVILGVNMELEQLKDRFVETGFTRIPIFESSIDNVIGIAHAKDLLAHWGETDLKIRDILRQAHFVPETKKLHELLREIGEQKSHLIIVVDEYGGTAGIVTLEDVLEELVGEILDEHDFEEPLLWEEEGGSILADGRLPDEEVAARFGVALPKGRYETLAGLITHILGRVPEPGEKVLLGHLEMTVEEADDRRVHRVRLKRAAPGASTGEGEA